MSKIVQDKKQFTSGVAFSSLKGDSTNPVSRNSVHATHPKS
jgi:hypothetical protein